MRRILKEIALAAWLPVTAGTITFATNWLVWFVVGPDCVPTATAACPKLPWGRYITYEVLGDCYLYSFLAMSVTGGSDAMLFIRELRNREKDKKIADERLEQEKQRYEQEKERNDRMMALTENMMQQTSDRAAAAEARLEAERAERREERAAAQARAEADRQALVASQTHLADALARFTDALERNANSNGNRNGS